MINCLIKILILIWKICLLKEYWGYFCLLEMIFWFVGDDIFGFKIRYFDCFEIKCGILFIVCFLFDLLGFVVFVVLVVRSLV